VPTRADARRTVAQGAFVGREVLVCVCGGIAAYKTATVVSRLVQSGCGVTVAMTRAARRFIGPLTFQALSARPVYSSLWPAAQSGDIEHLTLGQTADLILVAPATANTLGKLAAGIADDLVSSALLGAACPVLLAPAMNTRMWQHPATRRNVQFLVDGGYELIGPDAGWQACREIGPGRMSEPDAIVQRVQSMLAARGQRGSA
jgi:phosphopantothenoylcysteine decarboxylase/phosphopantothenate--cysteine ligase